MDKNEPEAPATPKLAPDAVELRAAPRPVTRLNRRTLALGVTVLVVAIAGASMWALQAKGRPKTGEQASLYNVDRIARADALDQLPADYAKLSARLPGGIAPNPATAATTGTTAAATAGMATTPTTSTPQLGPPLPGDWGVAAARSSQRDGDAYAGPSAEDIDRRQQAEAVTRSAVFFRTGNNAKPETEGASAAADTAAAATTTPVASAAAGAFNPMGAGSGATAAQPNDPTALQNRQDQKEAFLAKGGDTATGNTGGLQAPASPYTVMAGTIIPAALVTGINSDLPGQIIAQVTQPVYDTASGRYLLIPQGSRLIGRYDSQVAFGQERVLLVWLRLVLPDASSIALDKLPGIDPAGYAGLEDGVDWHWGRILGGAALSTLLGVNTELAVSNQGNVNGGTVVALRDSAQDTANQVGQEITRRNLSVQPTLTVRPGFRVEVMVNKDMVLRPYQPLFIQGGPMP